MQNLYGATTALLLIATPYLIVASLIVILGLALDLPGYVRKVRDSFRRANRTVAQAQDPDAWVRDFGAFDKGHDWESVYPADRK